MCPLGAAIEQSSEPTPRRTFTPVPNDQPRSSLPAIPLTVPRSLLGDRLPVWLLPTEESSTRRERSRDRKRNAILAVAAHVVAERGYYNTTIEEIAEYLDVGKASIYHYFDGKEPLVLAALTACAAYANGRLRAVSEGPGTATERLRGLIRQQLSMITVDAPEVSRLFLVRLEWPPQIAEAIATWQREQDSFFREILVEGVESGEFHPADRAISRHCLQGAMNNVPTWFARRLEQQGDAERIIETTVDTLMALVDPHPRGGSDASPT